VLRGEAAPGSAGILPARRRQAAICAAAGNLFDSPVARMKR